MQMTIHIRPFTITANCGGWRITTDTGLAHFRPRNRTPWHGARRHDSMLMMADEAIEYLAAWRISRGDLAGFMAVKSHALRYIATWLV